MVKTLDKQKLIIKDALTNVDGKPNKKIIFRENLDDSSQLNGASSHHEPQKSLFESDDEAEDDLRFELKPQFSGKKGHQLFELQTKYKGDKRFALDERFADANDEEENVVNGECSLEDEKKHELNILEQVLGTKIKTKDVKVQEDGSKKKRMVRYDPSQSDHVKFHVSVTQDESAPKTKKKKKLKDAQKEDSNIQEQEQPVVSKEIFYKVEDGLKSTLEEKQEFSLLKLFGQEEKDELNNSIENYETQTNNKIRNNAFLNDNPFHYDSSDDEPEEPKNAETTKKPEEFETKAQTNTVRTWFEPFFLKEDDYRLQEGSDFIKRLASENKSEFSQQRRDIKLIVRAKVRNNLRKNNQFKKKLGGNKRKKMIRIKKAMKK
ncbi:probable RNA-binding protein CG14230 [Tribolium castaneum]|uniref:Putative RNA-binding protein CG14230-like Protein n=1 Tax=Tribolium castaneum TaxID=7070 RepID=D6WQY2_TRICA|nr:PREDICTED: probable RNA-binding protein CG14230 [Tribolium castaneum]EFA06490.1 putative RNA-binding protein CG14230-like Protein [Tribolium castaneum]|eukprot:XP_968761.1 PREDICTED: probable RNA-binding protein CG14230 [Tribolium castaneum]